MPHPHLNPLSGTASSGRESAAPLGSPSWPVFLSLALVAALIAAMVGLDVFFAMLVSRRTSDIVENSQRSILLLNDIHLRAKRLAAVRTVTEVPALAHAITLDAQDYDRLAGFLGEREEWSHLQGLLKGLVEAARTHSRTIDSLDVDIDQSIAELVSINAMVGSRNLEAIRAANAQAIWSDVVAGAVVLGTVIAISAWLLRVLARQRRFVTERVQFLREKNSELEAFAGRAAHDLRSPMNPLRGYADLILETPSLPEGVAEMAQRIRRAVDRMARVVEDMLALSISGRPTKGQCSATVVIGRTVEEMGPELHGIEVVTRASAGRVGCSESVLNQLLRNLIGNAIKFRSPSRPLRLTVEARESGATVDIAVEDNGVGMDAESTKHAFEPFYRAQSERDLPGHGLGLAIVERTVRALGGSCELSSALDQGTRVLLRLPRS